jgi:tripartite-type tricarboxylate transporter receptor subunit TctC
MTMTKKILALLMAVSALLLAPATGLAQQAPTTRILLGFPPGASGDTMTRKLAEKLRDALGETVIVDNRPGAGGRIAMDELKLAKPDGHTLVLTPPSPLTSAPWLYKDLRYDPFKDFEPVAEVAEFKYVLAVGPQIKARNLREYVAEVAADPKLAFYSASSPGSAPHMAMEAFARAAKIHVSFVGYKGTANGMTDLIGGQLPAFMGNVADFVQYQQQGRVRILGVAHAERSRHLPEVPTFKEQGFDIEAVGWFGVYAPAGTPAPVIDRLSKAIVAAVQQPDVRQMADRLGLEIAGRGPAAMAALQKADYQLTGERIRQADFKIEE